MATLKEKEDLLESFKGPHFYRIRIWGYGAETSYMNISKEAHDFWKAQVEENGDSDAVSYVLNAEDFEADKINECDDIEDTVIPREAMFMHNEEGEGSTYYEPWDQFDATYGTPIDSAYLTVDKVAGTEYNAEHLEDIIEHEDCNDFVQRIGEETDWEVEVYAEDHGKGDVYPKKGQHICQFMSSEKGTFFETVIETALPFNQNLLKLQVAEAPNGEDLIYGLEYDGEEIDNDGGDTNGKGYYVYFYEQEY
tara:strand:+ start:46 stop:798 length:753 start_codon:yes stop_codon:yes gene_type:complete